jgi:hypothetical protein
MQEKYVDLTGETPVFGTLKELKPNVSIPKNPSVQILKDLNLYKLINKISYDRSTQRLYPLVQPVIDEDNRTYRTIKIIALPTAEKVSIIKAKKIDFIKNKKNSLQTGLLSFEGNVFQIDNDSKNTLNNAITLNLHSANNHGGTWTDVNNNPVPMSDDKLIDLGLYVGEFFKNVHIRKLTLEYQLNSANTLTAVNAIDETSGWPDNGVE